MLTKRTLPEVLKPIFDNMKRENIISAFKATGIYPRGIPSTLHRIPATKAVERERSADALRMIGAKPSVEISHYMVCYKDNTAKTFTTHELDRWAESNRVRLRYIILKLYLTFLLLLLYIDKVCISEIST